MHDNNSDTLTQVSLNINKVKDNSLYSCKMLSAARGKQVRRSVGCRASQVRVRLRAHRSTKCHTHAGAVATQRTGAGLVPRERCLTWLCMYDVTPMARGCSIHLDPPPTVHHCAVSTHPSQRTVRALSPVAPDVHRAGPRSFELARLVLHASPPRLPRGSIGGRVNRWSGWSSAQRRVARAPRRG